MAFEGMDVAQVQTCGNSLKTQGTSIGNVINAINQLVGQLSAAWQGRDAEQFKSQWESQHRPQLQAAQDAVTALGDSALRNAQEQADVSAR